MSESPPTVAGADDTDGDGAATASTARVVVWGTYDLGKPRTRLMLTALRAAGLDVIEIHVDVWAGVADKSQVIGTWARLGRGLRWLAAYPGLVRRYLRAPRHDAVMVGYLGHLDVLMLWPFARARRVPIIWDAFLSLPDTIVDDRRLVGAGHPLAWLLRGCERLACRAADRVVLDTAAHAAHFAERYRLPPGRVDDVMVGSEEQAFPPTPAMPRAQGRETTILFYGQFIPLHGIEAIVAAAEAARDRPYRWILIGRGQERARIDRRIAEAPAARIERIDWVDYDALAGHIARADICLGIFGASGKASRVIPNKIFQILRAGRPLITRDSPAIRELLDGTEPGIRLVRPDDPSALLSAVDDLVRTRPAPDDPPLHAEVTARFSEDALGRRWAEIVSTTVASHLARRAAR